MKGSEALNFNMNGRKMLRILGAVAGKLHHSLRPSSVRIHSRADLKELLVLSLKFTTDFLTQSD